MNIVRLIELLMLVLLVGGFGTQVLWPLVKQRPLFPFFRKSTAQQYADLAEERARDLERSIARETERLRKKNSPTEQETP